MPSCLSWFRQRQFFGAGGLPAAAGLDYWMICGTLPCTSHAEPFFAPRFHHQPDGQHPKILSDDQSGVEYWCRYVPGPISVPVPITSTSTSEAARLAWRGPGRRFHKPGLNVDEKNRLPIDFPIDFIAQVTASLCCSLTISCRSQLGLYWMRLRDRRDPSGWRSAGVSSRDRT